MNSLDAVGLLHGTDKSSAGHNYLNFYEPFVQHLRKQKFTLLEIGVLRGASLKMWADYFPRAAIVGADINPSTKRFENDRISVEILDQSNIEELTRLALKRGPFDIIIEDGSHMWEHQITSLRTLFPFLTDGGLYVVEDLQTNYGSMQSKYRGVASESCVEYLKRIVDLRVAGKQVELDKVEDAFLRTYGQATDFIAFYHHSCLLKKRFPPPIRERNAGHALNSSHPNAQSVSVNILAHVSYVGDIAGPSGYVNLGADRFEIQGFSIESGGPGLAYRVLQEDSPEWGPWCDSGKFAGSRAQSKALKGFSIRLKDDFSGRYSLRAFGRFAGRSEPVEIANGEECISETNSHLCGIQVAITDLQRR